MQVMLAVFDFPMWADERRGDHVPTLTTDWVAGDAAPEGPSSRG